MAVIFTDRQTFMPRRNYAALALVVIPPGAVEVPQAGLNLTGFAPSITQSSAPIAFNIRKYVEIDARTQMPRRNMAALALNSGITGNNPVFVGPPMGFLNIIGNAPTVTQGVTLLVGQNTYADFFPPEEFFPPRRDWQAYLGSQIAGQSINVPLGNLNLTGFAPIITVAGNLTIPPGSLTFTGWAPTVSQNVTNNQVDVPLGSLTLNGQPVAIQRGGNGFVFPDPGALNLTGNPPAITQALVPTYVPQVKWSIQRLHARTFTVSSLTGPRFAAKDPQEQILLTFDFSPDLLPTETLTGGPAVFFSTAPNASTPDPNPMNLANGGAGYDVTKTEAVVPVQGGIDGNDYIVQVVVPTSTFGKVLTLTGILPVRSGTGV